MNRNLTDYIVKIPFLEKDLCEQIVFELEQLDESVWEQHRFFNSKTHQSEPLSGNQELSTLSTDSVKNKELIMSKLWHGIEKYIKFLNFPWFNGWNGYTDIRFNRYSANTKMRLHCDHISSMFDGERKGVPILSCLGLLNNAFKGGEFIMFDDLKIELKQGELVIFPANFLYPHRVEPVTKGIRYSYISWVW